MRCPACQHDNRDGAKFCEECATPLRRACASCGSELRPAAKFCDECGTPAGGTAPGRSQGGGEAAPPAARERGARKIVTIVFADLVGSTALHERLDAEAVRRFMESYYAAMRGAVEAHGGRVTQVMGDGVKAVFGAPRVAEDDAIRAVRAAVAMQEAFRALADQRRGSVGQTGLRVAVNTGEVVADDAAEIIGDPVNVAARLQEQGGDGDVVIGGATQRVVASLVTLEHLGRFALKGRSEEVEAYRLVSLAPPTAAKTTAFVGREEELARLTAVYDAAVARPSAALAVLLGSPGLGKSRLIGEFVRRLGDDATVFLAHCDASGGSTFAPLVAALRAQLGIEGSVPAETVRETVESLVGGDEADRTRIVAGVTALLSGSPASPEETFFTVRRFLNGFAAAKPVVLVIDDLQWAEPLLLDLVEHLVQWGSGTLSGFGVGGVPLFVLIGARPELRDLRSSLTTPGGWVTDVLTLSGLDAGAAMRLAAGIVGAADLPAALAGKLLATSEGNPLFVRELVRMLVQDGVLEQQGGRWLATAAIADLEMPPTIHALLAARIERLGEEERTVLERAAVVGRHFSRGAVAALLPGETGALDARLEALRRSELIERDSGWFLGEPTLRFHHVLIRDAAYRRLLKGTRAELHARLARWIETQANEDPTHEETIGRHLEQAHRHRRELGPLDEEGSALGERAAHHLAAAGRRALAQDDVALAANLLSRALGCLPRESAERADLALDGCEALLSAGEVGAASAVIAELERLSAGSERLRAWHACFAGQLATLTDPQALHATADAVAVAAETLAGLGDAPGEAKGHFVHAQTLARLGQVGACEVALDRALAAARRAGDRRRANAVLAGAPRAALWGPSPVTRASGRCLDVVRVLRITQGAPAVEAVALSCQGVLEALRGRTDAAKRMIGSARRMVEELGIAQRLFEADVFAGRVALLERDATAAESSLRRAYEGLRDLGLAIDAAQAAALLANALLAQGNVADAEALSHESEALAGDDLQAAIAWRRVRAEALAQHGEHAAAVELAQAAVGIAAATDALLDHADARLALATALRAAGRHDEADAEERRAHELWEKKGATLLTGRTPAGVHVEPPTAERVPRAAELHRRVHPNLATALHAATDDVIAKGDLAALASLFHERYEEIDRPSGVRYGRDETVASAMLLKRSRDVHYRVEPLATLGERLMLGRRRAGASATGARRFDVGAYVYEVLCVTESDEQGRGLRNEVFSLDRLGDAVAHLYERYAELQPEGRERERAKTAARALGTFVGPISRERWAAALAPDVEQVDRRTLSLWSARGAAAVLEHLDALQGLAADPAFRLDDLLAATPSALLDRRTHTGIDRETGGVYERVFLSLNATGADGLVAHVEFFEPDREAEALARFDALTGATPASARRRRRVPETMAHLVERSRTVLESLSPEALAANFAEGMEVIHHPTGAVYGTSEVLALFRSLWRAKDTRFELEPIAALGDSLLLMQRRIRHEGTETRLGSIGPVQIDTYELWEYDDHERTRRFEIFDLDRLDGAIARLYGRHAELLPEGPERTRAETTARSVATLLAGYTAGPDAYVAAHHPELDWHDHRSLVGLGAGRGAEGHFRVYRATPEIADRIHNRIDRLLALDESHLLVGRHTTGAAREGGGGFEWVYLVLFAFGPDGRVARVEYFDPDREAEALARFDALVRKEETADAEPPFTNAASRASQHECDRWAARDWEALVAGFSPALRFDDRRRLIRLETGYDEFVVQYRMLFDQPGSRWTQPLVATRGERLSLHRVLFEARAPEGGGPLAFDDHLALIGVDAEGREIAIVVFDLEDEDAAWHELDVRFEAGEGGASARIVRIFREAVATGDWDTVRAQCAPDLIEYDHRNLAVLGTMRGVDPWLEHFRALVELAPDTSIRFEHLRVAARGFLWQLRWSGARGGSDYEIPFVGTAELDARGRLTRIDAYDPEQLDAARARFDEIVAAAEESPFTNRAARWVDRTAGAWAARDWDAVSALRAPGCRVDVRNGRIRGDPAPEAGLENLRRLFDAPGSRLSGTVLATRGERLALSRLRFEKQVDAGGSPLEAELPTLVEVDDHGLATSLTTFDDGEVETAWAELDACYAAGEPARDAAVRWTMDFRVALERRDWTAMADLFAGHFVGHDHRLVSWGTLNGPLPFLETLRQMVALSPDARIRGDHVRASGHAVLLSGGWVGTREGGAFESPFVSVLELAADGRAAVRMDFYDPTHLGRARERFEEIRRREKSAPLFASNAATAAMEAWTAEFDRALATADWDAVRQRCTPDMLFEDRTRFAGVSGDRELYVQALRARVELGARPEIAVLGTAGDRIAIGRSLWAGGPDEGRFEMELFSVFEVDGAGLLRAMILVDDARAAQREAWTRWAALEPAMAAVTAPLGELIDAFEPFDRARARAVCADDVVLEDHRRTGIGRIEGAEAYLDAVAALVALAPEARVEAGWRWLGCETWGALTVIRRFGTLFGGGGDFESEYLFLYTVSGGRITRVERFELEDRDAALARFAELGADR